ncbi:hypothetical protein GYB59_00600 [bacterium]|nr:hypothetical protein [bacterium]
MTRLVPFLLLLCPAVAAAQCGPNGCPLPPSPGIHLGAGISIQPRPRRTPPAYRPPAPSPLQLDGQWTRINNPQDTPCVKVISRQSSSFGFMNGVVIADDVIGKSYVATTAHGVMEAQRIEVVTLSGTHDATIVHESARYDVVILEVNTDLLQAGVDGFTDSSNAGWFVGYRESDSPVIWSIAGRRISSPDLFLRYSFSSHGGMSGGGVYSADRKLIGLVSNGEQGQQYTDVVPGSVVNRMVQEYVEKRDTQPTRPVEPSEGAGTPFEPDQQNPPDAPVDPNNGGASGPLQQEPAKDSPREQDAPAPDSPVDRVKEWAWDGLSKWGWAAVGAAVAGPAGIAITALGGLVHRRLKKRAGEHHDDCGRDSQGRGHGSRTDWQGGQQVPPPRNTDVGREQSPQQVRERIVEKIVDLGPEERQRYEQRIADLEQRQPVHYPAIETNAGLSQMRTAMRLTAETYPPSRKWIKTIEDVFKTLLSGEKTYGG